jgi:hypothetical protein
MTLGLLAVIATLPLVLVTALLGSTGGSTSALIRTRTGAEPGAEPIRASRDLGSSEVTKKRMVRLAMTSDTLLESGRPAARLDADNGRGPVNQTHDLTELRLMAKGAE